MIQAESDIVIGSHHPDPESFLQPNRLYLKYLPKRASKSDVVRFVRQTTYVVIRPRNVKLAKIEDAQKKTKLSAHISLDSIEDTYKVLEINGSLMEKGKRKKKYRSYVFVSREKNNLQTYFVSGFKTWIDYGMTEAGIEQKLRVLFNEFLEPVKIFFNMDEGFGYILGKLSRKSKKFEKSVREGTVTLDYQIYLFEGLI